MGEVATIELPRGDPGGVSDAGAALARVGGGFDRAGGAVGSAVSAVGSWEGSASVAFRDRAAGYEQALGSVDGVLAQARGALRRYEGELEQARERVRGLRREEEECVQRLELEQRRVKDAAQRMGAAGDRATQATLAGGLGDPFSLADQANAQRDLEEAEADGRRAERAVQRERDELDRLRRKAARERERVEEAERSAAAAVRQAAGDLPDVRLPSGEVSPPALAGTPFGPFAPSEFQRRVAAAGPSADAGAEDDDGSLLGKVVHGALDGLGFVPGAGAIPDGINAGLYALEGDKKNAAISAAAAVPLVGDIGKGGKILADGTKAVAKHGDEAAKAGAKGGDDLVDLATPERRRHILEGDPGGSGGHRPGTGISGKSEFPPGWSDDRIVDAVSDVATDPASVTTPLPGGRQIVDGTRSGVEIRVILDKAGNIVTGYPTNLPRNP
jgi:uncharacterized protein YukE